MASRMHGQRRTSFQVATFLTLAFTLLITPAKASPYFEKTPLRFQFFPIQSAKLFNQIRHENCTESYHSYVDARARNDYRDANHWLFAHENCLLDNMTELKKAEMSSALILLGLTPVLLSTMGPSLAEIGLVTLHRPSLALFLSLACPAVYPSRVMAYADDDVRNILRDRIPASATIVTGLKPWRHIVGVLEWLVAAAAAASTLYTSYELGVRTIFNQDGPVYFMPLILSLFPLLLHITASMSLVVQRQRAKRDNTQLNGAEGISAAENNSARQPTTFVDKALAWARWELTPTHFHSPIDGAALVPTPAVVVAHWVCRVFAILHVLYGVLVFSSLLFILATDAGIVVVRYLVSALVSKLLLAFQLGGMRVTHADARRFSPRDQRISPAYTL